MNTREEIIDALSGQGPQTSPPAVFTQTGTVEQMESCGCPWPDAIFNPDKMARLSLQMHRQFGFATAKVPFCLTAECEALGCTIGECRIDRQPAVVGSPYRNEEGIAEPPELMDPDEFVQCDRIMTVRSASEMIYNTGEVFTIGGCVDPMIAAMQMTGAEDFILGTILDPESCLKWITSLTPLFIEEVKMLSECTDDVQIVAMSDTEVLPAREFDRFVGAPVSRMISDAAGFTTIHSCGSTLPVIEKLSSLGETGLSVETHSDPEGFLEKTSRKVKLMGGISPVKTLLMGRPQDVVDSARVYSELGYPLITPECGVPPRTPSENLQVLSGYRNL